MICCDNQPFSIVENMGFKNFVNTLAPGTKIKSRYFYSSKGLDLLVANLEEQVKLDLKNAEELSMTSDGWSSQDKKHSLLSLTAHWIHKETFQPCFAVLGSRANYKNLDKFNIDKSSVVCITRDGATTMSSLCSNLNMKSIHCYAHLLQLSVKDMLDSRKELDEIVEKMKKITRKMGRSGIAQEAFKSILNEEGLPSRMLKKSTEVRWSSLLLIIRSFIQNKKVVVLLGVDYPAIGFPLFSTSDWELLEAVEKVLSPIAETTKSAQHRYLATASVIIPSICLLMSELDEFKDSEVEHVSDLAENLKKSIQHRCGKYKLDDMLRTSTFLDPRFKDMFFTSSHKDSIIRQLLKKDGSVSETSGKVDDVVPQVNETLSAYDKYLLKHSQKTPEPSPMSTQVEEEVTRYLRSPPSRNINPYTFWQNGNLWKSLARPGHAQPGPRAGS
ncbi:Protein CBG10699 [Caenorhabditis briggsae]|uniref:Protein CBG10699 n=1 Tax=Caenorhabditis briggsae TaxID=6238 RepID=A8XBL1_CAEBR|nr:Protein CBG10699 [Caenorhabditis briggsae]CAP30027.2 Protein CBG10699 [Caenorhabditis briggsae]